MLCMCERKHIRYRGVVICLHISFVSYCCAREICFGAAFEMNNSIGWKCATTTYIRAPHILNWTRVLVLCMYVYVCKCVCVCVNIYTIATATKKYSANHNAARQPIMHNSLCCGGGGGGSQQLCLSIGGRMDEIHKIELKWMSRWNVTFFCDFIFRFCFSYNLKCWKVRNKNCCLDWILEVFWGILSVLVQRYLTGLQFVIKAFIITLLGISAKRSWPLELGYSKWSS